MPQPRRQAGGVSLCERRGAALRFGPNPAPHVTHLSKSLTNFPFCSLSNRLPDCPRVDTGSKHRFSPVFTPPKPSAYPFSRSRAAQASVAGPKQSWIESTAIDRPISSGPSTDNPRTGFPSASRARPNRSQSCPKPLPKVLPISLPQATRRSTAPSQAAGQDWAAPGRA